MAANPKAITSREILTSRLVEARRNTDALFEIVRTDSLYERPIPERHRIIFYLGHLEAFDWNLFSEHASTLNSFAPGLDKLFAFGIDPVGGGLPSDAPEEWPSVTTVVEYKDRIRRELDASLARIEFARNEAPGRPSLETLLHVAIEHRLMHAETLAYMFHRLPFDKKLRPDQPPALPARPRQEGMVEIPGAP